MIVTRALWPYVLHGTKESSDRRAQAKFLFDLSNERCLCAFAELDMSPRKKAVAGPDLSCDQDFGLLNEDATHQVVEGVRSVHSWSLPD